MSSNFGHITLPFSTPFHLTPSRSFQSGLSIRMSQPDTSTGPSTSYSKYASLPDVDTSAPDVYESLAPTRASDTNDASRSRRHRGDGNDSDTDSSGSDSDQSAHRKHSGEAAATTGDIDSSSLKRNEAAAKFSSATKLDGGSADFSGRVKTRRLRKGKGGRARDAGLETSTYAISGAGEENLVDRLRRLKFEASQLEDEINATAAGANGSASKGAEEVEQVESSEVLAQLKLLQSHLASLPSPSTAAATPAGTTASNADVRTVLSQLKQSPASVAGSSDTHAPAAAAAGTQSGSNADMVNLESRLSELESTLGLQQALLNDSNPPPRPILSTLSRLEHQLSLLSQPRHLDAISRRVKVLVTEMDRVHETRRRLTEAPPTSDSSSTPALTQAEVTKLQQLFDVSTRLEPLLPLVPSVLSRLQTLAELHASAAHFDGVLGELEDGREGRKEREEELEGLLKRMEVNMDETRGKVERNLESLQRRIEELVGRVERLSS